MIHRTTSLALLLLTTSCTVEAFSAALFHETPTLQRTTPSSKRGVDIELPDFDELFERIQLVSPLAQQVIQRENGPKGFAGITDESDPLKWKLVEKHPGRAIEKIEKIDNFQGHPAPLLRFRSTFRGPCVGECFGSFIMDYDQRKKWDAQIAQVYEAYPIDDLDSANIAQGFGKYGDCSKLGIGYCKTKAIPGISPREQLTLCGIQDFVDGSCIIWGVEMEEWHDHLLPPGTRVARAKSHLFATTMVPTSEDTFDVEYVLQLEIGGKIPTWLTAPIVIENIKNCFKTAKPFFEGDGVKEFLENKKKEDTFMHKLSLLMTP